MHTVHKTPAVTLSAKATRDLAADLLIIPVFEDDQLADEADLASASGGEYAAARSRGEFTGKPFEQLFILLDGDTWKTRRALFVGAGRSKDFAAERLRRIAVVGGLAARQRHLTSLAIVSRSTDAVAAGDAVQALAEGAVIANYEGMSYKTAGSPCGWLERVELRVSIAGGEAAQALERGRVLGECTNLARELSNEPGNVLTPREFAHRAEKMGKEAGLSVEILDEKEIARLGMGLLLGVARGSRQPPRVVVLRHEPKNAVKGVVLGLVGKGITFDTGGISIKPAENMDKMKDDMSGGAAVLCAMAAMSRLNAPVRCIGVIPATENMPGGDAMKPGDILTSAEGKTVEVLNTDAEGRLILGDGLWYARQLGATHLVDVATLTGACVVALGKTTSGLFGSPDPWVEQVRRAGERAGDRSWPMPVFDDYKDLLKSEIADFTNTGGRAGGAISAALFIKEFAGELPWVHMDIAGTAWADESNPYQPKGATGVGVRTLAELALGAESWSNLK
jgi:leucyl aminopeptidase